MDRILIIGCGDIALRAAPLLNKHYCLFGLARSRARQAVLRQAGITPVSGDLDDAGSLHRLAGLAHIVLHFAPPHAPPLTRGGREGLCADNRTRHLLAALSRGALPGRMVYISTSGVYGDCGGAVVEETRPPNPQTPRAKLRFDAERQIRDWAARSGVNACVLRVPGIYAPDRLPLERLRAGAPAITHEEDSYTNHIHADDLAHIVVAALRHAKPGRVYHASDDSQMKMGEYFGAVTEAFGLPRPPRLPRAEAERAVSPALWSFMNESRRMTNARMKKELKVALRYPTVKDALKPAAP